MFCLHLMEPNKIKQCSCYIPLKPTRAKTFFLLKNRGGDSNPGWWTTFSACQTSRPFIQICLPSSVISFKLPVCSQAPNKWAQAIQLAFQLSFWKVTDISLAWIHLAARHLPKIIREKKLTRRKDLKNWNHDLAATRSESRSIKNRS